MPIYHKRLNGRKVWWVRVAHKALDASRVCATKEEAKTTVRAHAVALDVEGKLTQVFPGVAEVVAHVEPEDHG